MKYLLNIVVLFSFLNCFSQELMNVAVSNKTKLINEAVGKFNLDNDKWDIENYLYTMNHGIIDSLTFVELINKAVINKKEKWKKADITNIYLVKKGEVLSVKKVLSELNGLEKQEIKTLKKQIRQYKNNPKKWRSWPVSVSKPVFSNDKQYCILGFVFGNSGGFTELYKKEDSQWKRIAIFNRYAF